jgi:Rrf2 family protein
MLTKTTISAIRALIYLGLSASGRPLSPRQIADALGESPTYMSKITGQLVRAGILRAHRGVVGGVTFQCLPQEITLLAIMEACQRMELAAFCEVAPDLSKTCAFHQAAVELQEAVVSVMSRWTLDRLLSRPHPIGRSHKSIPCWMESIPKLPTRPSRQLAARKPRESRAKKRRVGVK